MIRSRRRQVQPDLDSQELATLNELDELVQTYLERQGGADRKESASEAANSELPDGWELFYERVDGSQVCPDTQGGTQVWLAFLERTQTTPVLIGTFPTANAAIQALDKQHPGRQRK